MATITQFEDLEIWMEARELSERIWQISNNSSLKNDYGLKDQMNRSSGSTMDNIVEGFGRGGNREFIQFLSIARGSNTEFQSQLYRCLDRGHIDDQLFSSLRNDSRMLGKRISKLIKVLNQSVIRGAKFLNNKP